MIKFLKFLRIVDYDGLLSLTNIAVITAIVKLASTHNASVMDLGALIAALISYGHKKVLNKEDTSSNSQMEVALSELKDKVSAITVQAGLNKR